MKRLAKLRSIFVGTARYSATYTVNGKPVSKEEWDAAGGADIERSFAEMRSTMERLLREGRR